MCKTCVYYLGQEVIWHDEYGNSIGPGTVTEVYPKSTGTILAVVEHSTESYVRLSLAHAQVERIIFDEEVYGELSELVRDEIRLALEYGIDCAMDGCTDPRLFGGELCTDHDMGAGEDNWPDFHDEAPDYYDDLYYTSPEEFPGWDY